MTGQLHSYPSQLSGGQMQRAHLARALVLEPAAFLLDEVTSSVDPRTAEDICLALQQIRRARGTSMLLVSHDFAVVKALADQVIFLHEGRNFDDIPVADFPGGFETPQARAFTSEINA
jgi:ABC-type glutathione transport system ATPase component